MFERLELLWPVATGLLALAILEWGRADQPALLIAIWCAAEFLAGYTIGLIVVQVVNRARRDRRRS